MIYLSRTCSWIRILVSSATTLLSTNQIWGLGSRLLVKGLNNMLINLLFPWGFQKTLWRGLGLFGGNIQEQGMSIDCVLLF